MSISLGGKIGKFKSFFGIFPKAGYNRYLSKLEKEHYDEVRTKINQSGGSRFHNS